MIKRYITKKISKKLLKVAAKKEAKLLVATVAIMVTRKAIATGMEKISRFRDHS